MNLAELRDFVANTLNYDPINDAYTGQIDKLLNDAQSAVLTNREWTFLEREGISEVFTDITFSVGLTLNSATVTGVGFPVSTNTTTPGSQLDAAAVDFLDSSGNVISARVAWCANSTTLYLTSPFLGATGTYTATFKKREITLPGNTMSLNMVLNMQIGLPQPQLQINRYERDIARLSPAQLGTPISFLMGDSEQIQAPRGVVGVSTAAAVAQGVRTVNVFMCNVWDLSTPTPSVYRGGVSGGRESALSPVATYKLTDIQTLQFVPETLPNTVGFYRRYYFTCPDLGIVAPTRIRATVAGSTVDTISPAGGVTLSPDLSTTTLLTQTFQAQSVRYVPSSGRYQNYMLYPHPSSDTAMKLRYLILPVPMWEDQDTPAIPTAYTQIIAYAALEQISLKMAQIPLSNVYKAKKESLFRAMEQAYLGEPARRIVKGDPTSGIYMPNPFGVLRYYP